MTLSEKNSDDHQDAMNPDELAAFEKIMGEIEGNDAKNSNPGPIRPESDPVLTKTEDDDSAELEMVEPETDAVKGQPPIDQDSDEGLDADQQEAFESIMAQIEGGADAVQNGSRNDQAKADTPDDCSAELEMVVSDADGVAGQPPADQGSNDNLDTDKQESVQKIKASIDSSEAEKAVPDSIISVSDDPKSVEAVAPIAAVAAEQVDSIANAEAQDISEDIEDILKTITSEDDASPLPEAAQSQPDTASKDDLPVEKVIADEDIVVPAAENSDLPKAPSPEPAMQERKVEQNDDLHETSFSNDRQDPFPPPKQPSADDGLQPAKKSSPEQAAADSPRIRTKRAAMVTVGILLFLGLSGYFYWPPPASDKPDATPSIEGAGRLDGVVEKKPEAQPQETVMVDFGSSDESRLKKTADNLDRLRQQLIGKRAEIEALRVYYQAGIDAEIKSIVDTVHASGKKAITLKTAMTDPRIRLGLAAIQRRDTYVKRLEAPANELLLNSEELLFFSRKAGLLALMTTKTSDIDVDGYIQQADEISDAHHRALTQLDVDAVPVPPLTMESIWQVISKRRPSTPAASAKKQSVTEMENSSIGENICNGDYSQKHKLTSLSPEASRCLAAWKGKDLFLNALTALSPEAARHLAAWDGEWLGLNGLKELSPETAMQLARWKGKGLSLNGLSSLSPQVVAGLAEWQGDQIELVNVKHMAHWENPKTRLFLSEGMKQKRFAARN